MWCAFISLCVFVPTCIFGLSRPPHTFAPNFLIGLLLVISVIGAIGVARELF